MCPFWEGAEKASIPRPPEEILTWSNSSSEHRVPQPKTEVRILPGSTERKLEQGIRAAHKRCTAEPFATIDDHISA